MTIPPDSGKPEWLLNSEKEKLFGYNLAILLEIRLSARILLK
jgi:hypothetical protein